MTTIPDAYVRTFGEGPRAALAVHCTLAHSGAWRGVGQALSDTLTMTAYDLPGHGKSPDWTGGGDLHRLCCDMGLPFMDAPVDLIGHSFGATVALRLAAENPAKVRTLTLIEPVFFAAIEHDNPQAFAEHEASAKPFTDALVQGDMARAAQLFNRLWGDGTKWLDVPEGTRNYMIDRMHIVRGQSPMIFEDNAHLLVPGALEKITCPVLLVQGARTVPVIDAIHAALAKRLPQARRVTIKEAGHMAPITHPARVAAAIRSLLEMA